jgi:hypothetical protein
MCGIENEKELFLFSENELSKKQLLINGENILTSLYSGFLVKVNQIREIYYLSLYFFFLVKKLPLNTFDMTWAWL